MALKAYADADHAGCQDTRRNKMAEENVPAPAPTIYDEQILSAFTASTNVPTIYIQQFWNTLTQDAKYEVYSFQLDEQWFTLNVDLLCKALEITPEDSAHPFVSPPAGEQVIDFMNELADVSLCRSGSRFDTAYWETQYGVLDDLALAPRIKYSKKLSELIWITDISEHPWIRVSETYWVTTIRLTPDTVFLYIHRTNVDYAKLLWEDFVPAIQIFFTHQANLTNPTKKSTPHVIPYCRFTKLIIYYLGSRHNIHRRPESAIRVMGDDFLLGNLKFVPKGKKDEVFGKHIPNVLTTDAIRNSEYYQQYLEMVACKPTAKEGGQKKTASEADKPKKSTPVKKHAPAKQTKQVKEKSTKPAPSKKANKGKAPVNGVAIRESTSGVTRSLPVVEGKGKAIVTDEQAAQSLLDLQQPKKKTDTKRSTSKGDTEILIVDEEQDEDQAGSNQGQSHVALDGPNPEPMHKDFIATAYPKVYESLMHTTEEHVLLGNPPSSSETLSSMKNLDDAFTYGDQFLYDKPTKEEPCKANVETKVESMVIVPIHQASSTAPPFSTPVIYLTQPKPVSPPIQKPIFTATTETTTKTLLPPPPPQQQSNTYHVLVACVSALEQICDNLAKKNKQWDQTS
ncbi:hypothetical protein Tco_0033285 [Tanacetum coccineum]